MQLKNITLKISAGSITFGEYKIENINFEINIPEFNDEEAKQNDANGEKQYTKELLEMFNKNQQLNTILNELKCLDFSENTNYELGVQKILLAKEIFETLKKNVEKYNIGIPRVRYSQSIAAIEKRLSESPNNTLRK